MSQFLAAGIAALFLAQSSPPAAMPEGFVHLAEIAPQIVQDMRYAGPHNFTGAPVEGYEAPVCILTRPAADALAKVQAAVEAQGFGLMVWDCYRPATAVAAFVRWSGTDDEAMKVEFYPRVPKDELFQRGYIATRSRHSAGSTVDVTLVPKGTTTAPVWAAGSLLVDCAAPFGLRFADGGVDMGTGYDCFDEKAHLDAARLNETAIANRKILHDAMLAAGFAPYAEEWWHFTLKDEPFAGEIFGFPVR